MRNIYGHSFLKSTHEVIGICGIYVALDGAYLLLAHIGIGTYMYNVGVIFFQESLTCSTIPRCKIGTGKNIGRTDTWHQPAWDVSCTSALITSR